MRKVNPIAACYLFIVLIFSSTLMAENKSLFSLTSALTGSTDLREFDDVEKSYSSDLEIWPRLNFKNGFGFKGYFAASKNLTGERKQTIGDGYLATTKSFKKLGGTKLGLSTEVRATLPMSEKSNKSQSMITKINSRFTFSYSFDKGALTGLTVYNRVAYTQGFYQYQTASNGKSNTQRSYNDTFILDYNATDKWSINASAGYTTSYSFKENRKKDKFLLGQEIGYSFSDNYSLAIGHYNMGNAQSEDNISNNIELNDRDGSTLYTTLTLSF